MDIQTITTEAMAARVQAGDALPLLPEGVPGPVQHAGQWWAVPTDAADYQLVTDPAQVAMLNRNARRYAAARTATAHAHVREGGGSS